jgi:hypothetical protein
MATFGYTDVGASSQTGDTSSVLTTKVVLTENGTVTKLSLYVGTAGFNFKIGLYNDNTGYADLLQVAGAETAAVGTSWNDVAVADTLLSAGTYWIGVVFSPLTTAAIRTDSGVNNSFVYWYYSVYGDALYAHLTLSNYGLENKRISAYATYTAASTYSPKTRSGLVNTMTTLLNSKILFS